MTIILLNPGLIWTLTPFQTLAIFPSELLSEAFKNREILLRPCSLISKLRIEVVLHFDFDCIRARNMGLTCDTGIHMLG